jgi:hypothetical protein
MNRPPLLSAIMMITVLGQSVKDSAGLSRTLMLYWQLSESKDSGGIASVKRHVLSVTPRWKT